MMQPPQNSIDVELAASAFHPSTTLLIKFPKPCQNHFLEFNLGIQPFLLAEARLNDLATLPGDPPREQLQIRRRKIAGHHSPIRTASASQVMSTPAASAI